MTTNLTIDEFRDNLEACKIGFKYAKNSLFKYLLGPWNKMEKHRVGIVVSIQFNTISEGKHRPYLLFKRLETNYYAGSGDISLHSYDNVYLDFNFIDMSDKSIFDINIISPTPPILKLDVKTFKPENDTNCFHKSLFSIAQLKIIKEFSLDEIVFSPAYVNYKSSIFYSDKINNCDWFTFKLEGNFRSNTNLILREEDGTHLPIIEVGSPCPPMWHDGETTDG